MMKMKYEKPVVETIEANAENVLMAGSPITGSADGSTIISSGTGSSVPTDADAKGNDGLDIWSDGE